MRNDAATLRIIQMISTLHSLAYPNTHHRSLLSILSWLNRLLSLSLSVSWFDVSFIKISDFIWIDLLSLFRNNQKFEWKKHSILLNAPQPYFNGLKICGVRTLEGNEPIVSAIVTVVWIHIFVIYIADLKHDSL